MYKMQQMEVSCAVRPIQWPLGVKWLIFFSIKFSKKADFFGKGNDFLNLFL